MPGDIVIEFQRVSYRLPDGRALFAGLDLQVHRGETLVLVGRSGSGKSTALKLVNRLFTPSEGEVWVEGKPASQWDVIQLRRRIGYAIQDVGLFPHYTVEKNIGLVPSLEGWPEDKTRARIDELMRLLRLDSGEFRARYPHQLSGGQRQRVGLARGLAADPPILLMDEPFGALDAITRAEMQREFLELQQRLGKTVMLVTHDLREALMLGTRIGLMEAGRLHGVYSCEEFRQSQDSHVAALRAAFENGNMQGCK